MYNERKANKMTKLSKISAALLLCAAPTATLASNNMIDARGSAMGNTGVASADYLSAGLYNPALTATFRDIDDVGMLLGTVGVEFRDKDENATQVDEVQGLIDDFEAGGSVDVGTIEEINDILDALEGNRPTTISANLGFAIAIPSNVVSTSFFSRAYLEGIAAPQIAPNTGDDLLGVINRYDNSSVTLKAFGSAEIGLALGKSFKIAGQDVSFGVSPKFQQLRTFSVHSSIQDFDTDNAEDSMVDKSAFNMDLGATWHYGDNVIVGMSIRDVIEQQIEVHDISGNRIDSYTLNPMTTLGVAYNGDFFTAALDVELTKQERFSSLNDETQYARFGVETNFWDWAALRAGYEVDLEDNAESSISAGVGLSPFDLVSLDIAASYAGENQAGVSANLAVTF